MLGLETVQQEMDFSNYLWLVIIPEVLINVYQMFFKIESKEVAEQIKKEKKRRKKKEKKKGF